MQISLFQNIRFTHESVTGSYLEKVKQFIDFLIEPENFMVRLVFDDFVLLVIGDGSFEVKSFSFQAVCFSVFEFEFFLKLSDFIRFRVVVCLESAAFFLFSLEGLFYAFNF